MAIVVAIICYRTFEFYPFSSFPMYSNPDGFSDYLYVTDQHDKPIPTQNFFGQSVPKLKKTFNSFLREAVADLGVDSSEVPQELRYQAGLDMMYLLLNSRFSWRPELPEGPLRLYYVGIHLEDRELVRKTELIVEVEPTEQHRQGRAPDS